MAAASLLRERVTVLTAGPGLPDGQGGTLPGGAGTGAQVWARVQPLRGTAQLALGAVATGQVYTVTLRTGGPVAGPSTRLRWRGKTLTVQAVAVGERRDVVVLTCFDNGRN